MQKTQYGGWWWQRAICFEWMTATSVFLNAVQPLGHDMDFRLMACPAAGMSFTNVLIKKPGIKPVRTATSIQPASPVIIICGLVIQTFMMGCMAQNSWFEARDRYYDVMSEPKHNSTSAHSVIWNTECWGEFLSGRLPFGACRLVMDISLERGGAVTAVRTDGYLFRTDGNQRSCGSC